MKLNYEIILGISHFGLRASSSSTAVQNVGMFDRITVRRKELACSSVDSIHFNFVKSIVDNVGSM